MFKTLCRKSKGACMAGKRSVLLLILMTAAAFVLLFGSSAAAADEISPVSTNPHETSLISTNPDEASLISTNPHETHQPKTDNSRRAVTGADILDTATKYVGYPYGYQCAGPNAFDCGGFVWYVFDQAGLTFPLRENSDVLAAANEAIYDIEQLEVGDIVFFGSSPAAIGHWGIYAGGGQIIHSYNSYTGVVFTPIDEVIPGFAYACRIKGLLGCNMDIATADPTAALPRGTQSALIPPGARGQAEDQIAPEQFLCLLYQVCELATGRPVEEFFGGENMDIYDEAALWTDDTLALASRALHLAELLAADFRGDRTAAAGVLLSCLFNPEYNDGEMTTLLPVPHIDPDYPHLAAAADPAEMLKLYLHSGKHYTFAQAYQTAEEIFGLLVGIEDKFLG